MKRNSSNQVDKHLTAETHFADPAEIKVQRPLDMPKDGINSPWDYRCPQYDQRSSKFINAGTHYGIGLRQPIGHLGAPKDKVNTLPYGRVSTMRSDEVG